MKKIHGERDRFCIRVPKTAIIDMMEALAVSRGMTLNTWLTNHLIDFFEGNHTLFNPTPDELVDMLEREGFTKSSLQNVKPHQNTETKKRVTLAE